jgi:sodium-independent sulfate anion transporter 11
VQSQATSFSSKAAVALTSCIQTEVSEMCTKQFVQRRLPFTQWLPQYNISTFGQDMLAGLTVALTLIPQSMAYADVAGLPPQVNLWLHMQFS